MTDKRVPDDLVDGAEIRAAEIASMSEKRYQNQIIELARKLGWGLIYHTWSSKNSEAGFPDLVCVKPPRVILIEIKSEKGRVSPAQQEWLDTLAACPGVEVYITRPSGWDEMAKALQ